MTSEPQKTLAFHSTGCLIGILRMVCYGPHITGQYNLLYTINNQCPFFIAQVEPVCIHLQGFFDVSFQLLSIFFTSWLCFLHPHPLPGLQELSSCHRSPAQQRFQAPCSTRRPGLAIRQRQHHRKTNRWEHLKVSADGGLVGCSP